MNKNILKKVRHTYKCVSQVNNYMIIITSIQPVYWHNPSTLYNHGKD